MRSLLLIFLFATTVAHAEPSGSAEHALLLAKWDAMMPGAERDALADKIDHVAGQRYATTSRLYWYQNLEEAKAEAKRTGKPILSLRMLGRLDEDLSCANSRYFRIALYANKQVSKFLRESFVLHWASERPVPRITIDFGDGRKLERTITGNSIHYVLDADGMPVDALPGLYAPAVFEQELRGSIAMMAKLPATNPGFALSEQHRLALVRRTEQWQGFARVTVPRTGDGFRQEAFALASTITKSGIEVPTFRVVDLGVKVGDLPDDANAWAQLGLRLLPNTQPAAMPRYPGLKVQRRTYYANPHRDIVEVAPTLISAPEIIDANSRALLAKLGPMMWTDKPTPATPAELARIVDRFERDILADTAMNEFDLRLQVHGLFINGPRKTLEQLNEEVYRAVFATPKDDPWLGLRPSGITALPADGVVR